jgi:predicted DNA binding protein
MSVIAEIRVPSEAFELGRTLDLSAAGAVELESLVPAGERAVPYIWVYDADVEAFEAAVEGRAAVEDVSRVDTYDDRALYTFAWSVEADRLLDAVRAAEGHVLTATGSGDAWEFELRFSTHDSLSAFQDRCQQRGVDLEVLRVYEPDRPGPGPWFGLTEPQREALVLAVEQGYYDVPRDCPTADLAEELGVSDQAVTERLRRAIVTLSSNTVLSSSDP